METSDRVRMEVGGRRFAGTTTKERFTQPVPNVEVFRELAAAIRQDSKILALKADDLQTKLPIYAAYAQDLDLLRHHHAEFQDCIRSAVRCSIPVVVRSRSASAW